MKCTCLCSCCECTNFSDQNTDENNLSGDDNDGGLLFELDGDDTGFDGIFEEQNDDNARRYIYYLRSAVDQHIFTHSIFSFGSTVDKVNVWSWLRS